MNEITPSTWTGTVSGMTCGHCVASVTEELSDIPGATSVDVVLESGLVTVMSELPVDPADVVVAISEAGYALA